MTDWLSWHAPYSDPASSLTARLHRVQQHLAHALEQAAPGPIRLVSLCAGQGHDVCGVLAEHPRRSDVLAVLIESDPRNVELARDRALRAGLSQLEVRQADASRISSFADLVPVDVLMLCGIFGNVSLADIARTIETAAGLCVDGATVIWTRHRRPPDVTIEVRAVFAASGFDEIAFDALDGFIGIGVNRVRRRASAAMSDGPMFRFVDDA